MVCETVGGEEYGARVVRVCGRGGKTEVGTDKTQESPIIIVITSPPQYGGE